MKINAISSMNFGNKQNVLREAGMLVASAPAVALTAYTFVRGISFPNIAIDDSIKLLNREGEEEALGEACAECIGICCGFPSDPQ